METPPKTRITVRGAAGPSPTTDQWQLTANTSPSAHQETPAETRITLRGAAGHLPTTDRCQLTVNTVLKFQVPRLFEDVHIRDVRKMDICDSISEKIRNLEEISSALMFDCESKEYIAKDPVMKELVREFIDMNLDTSKFCYGLAKSLSMEKTKHEIIENLLRNVAPESSPLSEARNVAPGSPPLNEAQLNRVREEVEDFLKAEDPFKDLQQQYKPLLERYAQLRKNVQEKIEKLSKKSKAGKVRSNVLKTMLAVVATAAVVTCVVVVVVAPITAPVVVTAISLYATGMGILGEMMVSSLKEGKRDREAQHMTEKIEEHTTKTATYLKEIDTSVDGLNRFREPIVHYVDSYRKDHDILDLADIAKEIKKLKEKLLPSLDDLVKKVDGCLKKLEEQIEDLKQLVR